ncbi:hypothetical protein [Rickettsia asiatica]|uniref:hypothetical protein n=1 Tax=Rickettsia asiatica TaxID=238800 RepID=UPI00155B34A1|nr:hypothetical protein [Rickettsia asiatica]
MRGNPEKIIKNVNLTFFSFLLHQNLQFFHSSDDETDPHNNAELGMTSIHATRLT